MHAWPDALVQRNVEMIKSLSGITPAYDGSISSLEKCMEKCGTSRSLVNNIVLKPELMRKANDWTAKAVAASKGRDIELLGMGWLIAGAQESVEEAERCANELGFKAFKMHHSHMKILPEDPKNFEIYEKISQLGLPVLFHCGRNPYARDSSTQYCTPDKFEPVLSSFDRMKVILGHFAGFEDDPEDARQVLSNHRNAVADTAIDFSEKPYKEVVDFIRSLGVSRFVFGSDFPIHDPAHTIDWLKKSLDQDEFDSITNSNFKGLFRASA